MRKTTLHCLLLLCSVCELARAQTSGLIPNTTVRFSPTPAFPAGADVSYSMTLTGNVTSSAVTGTPLNGDLLRLTLAEDATGGRTFAFPGNFVFTPGFALKMAALAMNELTFKFDGTNWHQISNSDAVGLVNTFGPFVLNRDLQLKGPNPYVDVRAYGVRAVSSVPSATTSVRSGSTTAILNSASTFRNGDGVVCRGCGTTFALSTPSAPTVTPSVAAALTGTGVVATNATGGTTYQYCVVARDTAGGYSPCSAVTSISTGSVSLGVQSMSISSISRTNNVATVTTSSAHGLVAGAFVWINGSTELNFDGWFQVSTAPTSTTFTYISGQDTRNGALPTGGKRGTATWYNCNHVTWAHVSNAWQYLIYGRTLGGMVLLGVSKIDNTSFSTNSTYNEFDDFGPTMTSAMLSTDVPDYYPLRPPSSAKNDDLVTTIVSGAGTTSLTLAVSASSTVSGATFKFDNAPTIRTAAAASVQSGAGGSVLYFPFASNQLYVTNSVLNLCGFNNGLSVLQAGLFGPGETVEFCSGTWAGEANPAEIPQFAFMSLPYFSTSTAIPMLYTVNGMGSFSYLNMRSSQSNSALLVEEDDGGQIPATTWDHVQFTSSGSNDYMGMDFLARGSTGTAGFFFRFCMFSSNLGVTAIDATPLVYFDGVPNGGEGGTIKFENTFMNRRGMLFKGSALLLLVDQVYEQGGIMPMFSIANGVGGNVNIVADIRNAIEDTMVHPLVDVLTDGVSGTVRIVGTSGPSGGYPIVSGYPVNVSMDGVFSHANLGQSASISTGPISVTAIDGTLNTSAQTTAEEVHDSGISVGTPYQVFVNSLPQVAPTCSVSSGGSVAVDSYTFIVAPLFSTGGEGSKSRASASCRTSSGNQTITINWVAVSGAIGYDLYKATSRSPYSYFGYQCIPPWVPGTATSYVWSSGNGCGGSIATHAGSGPPWLTSSGVDLS